MEFEVGYEYIYAINLFLFTCFFCPLQPIIVVFAVASLTFMLWAQKYSLFNRCKRPAPGNNHINTTMYQLIYLGPAFYTLGSFCWSHFFNPGFISYVPNLLAAVTSILILATPYHKLALICFDQKYEEERFFGKDRIFLPSEYDRLNPATSENGIKDYLKYVKEYGKTVENLTPEEVRQIEMQLFRNLGMGGGPTNDSVPDFMNYINMGAGYNDNQILLKNKLGLNRRALNPYMMGNTVLYNRSTNTQNPMHMLVQRWAPNGEFNMEGRQTRIRPKSQLVPGSSDQLFPMTESRTQSQ
jgi:hypothetical protein